MRVVLEGFLAFVALKYPGEREECDIARTEPRGFEDISLSGDIGDNQARPILDNGLV